MTHETAPANDAALDALALAATDRVLDVGCGHGRAIERAAEIAVHGHVAGLDLSEGMVRLATRRCQRFIAAGRADIRRGDGDPLPYPAESFDKVLSIHTLYFWHDPAAVIRELWRVMAPGGRLVIGFRPKEDAKFVASFPASVYRFYAVDEVTGLLFDSGFERVEARLAPGTPGVMLATAERSRA